MSPCPTKPRSALRLGSCAHCLWAVLTLLLIACLPVAGSAAGNKKPPTTGTLYNQPVKFPGNGHYYELVKAQAGDSERGAHVEEIPWYFAVTRASERYYNGRRGRLAVVDSKALNDWLAKTFHPRQITWIGLRYWCKYNKLQWENGTFWKRGDYANWDRVWARASTQPPRGTARPRCKGKNWFWPVHYWGIQHGFHWNANGYRKEGHAYFVEYPAKGK